MNVHDLDNQEITYKLHSKHESWSVLCMYLYLPNEVRGILWICDRRAASASAASAASAEISLSTLYRVQFSTDFPQILYVCIIWLGYEAYWFWSHSSSKCGRQGAKTKKMMSTLSTLYRLQMTIDFLYILYTYGRWQGDDTYLFWLPYSYNYGH